MKQRFTILMIVALAVGVLAPTGHAGMVLSLSDGVTTMTIADGGVGDLSAAVGKILFDQVIGNWDVSGTGVSKPFIGPATDPEIDLSSFGASSAGGGTLTLMLTDTGFSLLSGGSNAVLVSSIGGTTDGIVTFDQILDSDNEEFGAGLTVSLGPFGSLAASDAPFAGSASLATPVADGAPFSITEVIAITHRGVGHTSFDGDSHVVPVPGAILLGFLGLGAAGLKLRRFA